MSPSAPDDDNLFLGESAAAREVRRLVGRAGRVDSSVLISGESGVGKELVARDIHLRSSRAGGPFIAVNCAAIPQNLVESELFGHERGAFTDARGQRHGVFELAHGGTLFLDEIGDLSLEASRSCCASWRPASSSVSEASGPARWTSGSSPRRTPT